MSSFIFQILTGVSSAGTLFIAASGLTLIFGALRLVNLAHGTLYMYGAYVATMLLPASGAGLGMFVLTLLVAPLAAGAVGYVIEVTTMRRLYKRDHLAQLLATFALAYILDDLALQIWGPEPRSLNPPKALAGSVKILGRQFPDYEIFVIAAAVVVAATMAFILQRTAVGTRVRAALDDPELLSALGTNVRVISTAVFVTGAFLAGLAGVVAAPVSSVGPGIDLTILLDSFVVVIIGGVGSLRGAAVAAVLVSCVRVLGASYAPSIAPLSVYMLMILVLVVRPQGLLGSAEA